MIVYITKSSKFSKNLFSLNLGHEGISFRSQRIPLNLSYWKRINIYYSARPVLLVVTIQNNMTIKRTTVKKKLFFQGLCSVIYEMLM